MPSRWHYYLIFAFSGGAALIYESLWARYLKIFLGHAAYAQSLILAVFLFGLAAGSMLAARYVARMSRPLLAYAAVEAVLALFAMYFHDIFVVAQAWALDDILPRLPVGGDIFKWTLGACLALPQTILLGATFPLLAAAIMRRWPKSPGNTVSVLYFSNSFGAALGVLAGGFALTPALGLPGAMLVGGIINAAIAALVWFFSRRFGEPPINTATENSGDSLSDSNESESIANSSAHAEDAKEKNVATGVDSDSHADSTLVKVLLAAAAITGMSSFVYEIIWTRLISLLLGASTYSFEIMLAVFIFGLALGGWLIRRRADRPASLSLLAKVQIAMGLLALLSLPLYPWLFKLYVHYWPGGAPGEWVHWRFFLFGGALAMALILPSAVCAGMTLPLITRRLLQSRGESALGSVYAANTLGAIVGVVATVNWLLPETGVKNAMIIGAGADLILGCCLFYYAREGRSVSVSSLISAAAAAAVFFFGGVPLKVAASGAYRTGNLLGDDFKVVFYRDGKTASVSVLENENLLSIRTNGKADASIHKDSESYTSDETTMTMSGLLPLLARPDARLAANIGFGSGLTSRTLLLSPNLQRLDNIEIEPMMALGARRMGERVEPVFSDPRNHFIFDDAKTVFARATERYDIIVSEPSNPWISGIGGLFTREFYRRVRRSLNDNGVFCAVAAVLRQHAAHFCLGAVGAVGIVFRLSDVCLRRQRRHYFGGCRGRDAAASKRHFCLRRGSRFFEVLRLSRRRRLGAAVYRRLALYDSLFSLVQRADQFRLFSLFGIRGAAGVLPQDALFLGHGAAFAGAVYGDGRREAAAVRPCRNRNVAFVSVAQGGGRAGFVRRHRQSRRPASPPHGRGDFKRMRGGRRGGAKTFGGVERHCRPPDAACVVGADGRDVGVAGGERMHCAAAVIGRRIAGGQLHPFLAVAVAAGCGGHGGGGGGTAAASRLIRRLRPDDYGGRNGGALSRRPPRPGAVAAESNAANQPRSPPRRPLPRRALRRKTLTVNFPSPRRAIMARRNEKRLGLKGEVLCFCAFFFCFL